MDTNTAGEHAASIFRGKAGRAWMQFERR